MMINDNPHRLNSQQMRFCYEFLVDNEPIEAARRSDYKSPGKAAANLIANPDVVDTIIGLRDERTKRTNITIDKVVLEAGLIAFANIDDCIGDISNVIVDENGLRRTRITFKAFRKLPRGVKAAIASVKETRDGVEIKWYSKLDALDKLMRHLGGYNDKLSLEGGINPIKIKGVLTDEIREKLSEIYNQEGS
jgi:phage terminase small subunit